jgi:hypothetical protein
MAVATCPFNRLWALLMQNLVSLQTNCSYLFSIYRSFSHNSRILRDRKALFRTTHRQNRRPHRLDHKTSTHLQMREFAPNRYMQHLWPIQECNPSANTAERGEVDTTARQRRDNKGWAIDTQQALQQATSIPKPLEAQRRTSLSSRTFAAKPIIHFCAQHATIHTIHLLSISILSLLIFSSIYDSIQPPTHSIKTTPNDDMAKPPAFVLGRDCHDSTHGWSGSEPVGIWNFKTLTQIRTGFSHRVIRIRGSGTHDSQVIHLWVRYLRLAGI